MSPMPSFTCNKCGKIVNVNSIPYRDYAQYKSLECIGLCWTCERKSWSQKVMGGEYSRGKEKTKGRSP